MGSPNSPSWSKISRCWNREFKKPHVGHWCNFTDKLYPNQVKLLQVLKLASTSKNCNSSSKLIANSFCLKIKDKHAMVQQTHSQSNFNALTLVVWNFIQKETQFSHSIICLKIVFRTAVSDSYWNLIWGFMQQEKLKHKCMKWICRKILLFIQNWNDSLQICKMEWESSYFESIKQ